MLKLLKSLGLLGLTVILACVMLPVGILWTIGEIGVRIFSLQWIVNKNSATEKSLGYLSSIIRSIAVGIDQIGNSVCRDLFNRLLIKSGWYKFGKVQETISSVLGKNERDWTLTAFGGIIVEVLDWIDKDHCKNCIQNFTSLTNNEDG